MEIKKCPFCGGEAKVLEEYDCMVGVKVYFIECCKCKATFLHGNTKIEKEIEKWNRRVDDGREEKTND